MGYFLSSIYSISPDDTHKYFVFYIAGHGLEDTTSRWVSLNFGRAAQLLGPTAVIVRGLTEEFDEEVLRLYGNEIRTYYLGQRWEANFDVRAFDRWISGEIAQQHSDIDWRDLASALIVTNKNPHRKDTGQVFYVVPLGKLHHEREIHEIVTVILDCIKSDDFGLLEAELTKRYGKEVANGLKLASQFFELKPNVAGIGLNLNAVIDAYLNKQK